MGILPTLGTCSNCSSQTGAYKSEGLYNYFRCSNCKKKQSLLQNTFLSNSNTTLHDYVLLMYQSSHLQYCCKGNFPASTTEKVKVYTHKIVWHYKSCKWFLQILQLLNKWKFSKKWIVSCLNLQNFFIPIIWWVTINALWGIWKMGWKVVNFYKLFLRPFSSRIWEILHKTVWTPQK